MQVSSYGSTPSFGTFVKFKDYGYVNTDNVRALENSRFNNGGTTVVFNNGSSFECPCDPDSCAKQINRDEFEIKFPYMA